MNNKGYFYTVITATLILISLSIIIFYFQTAETKIESTQRKIALEELHYFVENLKLDYEKALEISGTRAGTVLIGRILNSSENFADYEMVPCDTSKYGIKGSQSAMAELMLCGTLFGEKISEMENNTLMNWSNSVVRRGDVKINSLEIINVALAMYDSWNIAAVSVLELSLSDKSELASFDGSINVVSLIPIENFEDPLYYLETHELDLVRKYKRCNYSNSANGITINTWINDKCYHNSNESYNGSCFFDRLEGRLKLSEEYLTQSRAYFANSEIGLESFASVSDLWMHNITLDFGKYTWVDYMYWQNVNGTCKVTGTINYAINSTQNITFRIDSRHVAKYNISGAECE